MINSITLQPNGDALVRTVVDGRIISLCRSLRGKWNSVEKTWTIPAKKLDPTTLAEFHCRIANLNEKAEMDRTRIRWPIASPVVPGDIIATEYGLRKVIKTGQSWYQRRERADTEYHALGEPWEHLPECVRNLYRPCGYEGMVHYVYSLPADADAVITATPDW